MTARRRWASVLVFAAAAVAVGVVWICLLAVSI
jgi:hypothetical protein